MEVAPQTTLDIRVLPRSSRNEIVEKQGNIYRIKLTAPAIEGKANKALITLLSKRLGLPKAKIQLISGERSRTKTIRIQGLPPEQVEALLKSD